jgi:sugar transferase (PEP-CTERM/EpsH1 system associated)
VISQEPKKPEPVLYLTHRVPYPPDKGDRIRNYHLLRQLATRGRVWLGSIADEPVPPETVEVLRGLCERVAIVPIGRMGRWIRAGVSFLSGRSLSEGLFSQSQLRNTIREWAAQTRFTAAVASASSLAPYLQRDGLESANTIIDLVDVDSQKWFDYASASKPPRSWVYRLEAARVRKLEARLPRSVRAISVVSRAEADIYDSLAGSGSATVATNGVDLEYFHPTDQPLETACAFVGAMDYVPNVDGVLWFAREVWPAIRARFPQAEFRIVGRKPASAVQALSSVPGIFVTGSVPDVRPYVSTTSVVVAPLRLGRGVQNKVLEALAMGKAVVASPSALAALQTESGRHLLKASTAPEWIDALSDLLENAARCRELGSAGRRYAEQNHHWEKCLEPLLQKIFNPAVNSK